MDYDEKDLVQQMISELTNLTKQVKRIADKFAPEETRRHGPCIVAGQMVATPDGTTPVEELQEGAQILAYDTSSGKTAVSRVCSRRAADVDNYLLINGKLAVTDVHRLFSTKRGWVPASSTTVGESLQTIDGPCEVDSIERISEEIEVYAIQVEPQSCFFANRYLVHNKP